MKALKSDEGSYWYDTLLSYPAGMFYSCFKKNIDSIMKRKPIYYSILLFAILLAAFFYKINSYIAYNMLSCIFCLIIVLCSMRIKIYSAVLKTIGAYSFFIYILQRAPMIILKSGGGINNNMLFAVISFSVTLIISLIFKKIVFVLDRVLK